MPAPIQAVNGMRNHRRQQGMSPAQQSQYEAYLSSISEASKTRSNTRPAGYTPPAVANTATSSSTPRGGMTVNMPTLPGAAPKPSNTGHTMPVAAPSSKPAPSSEKPSTSPTHAVHTTPVAVPSTSPKTTASPSASSAKPSTSADSASSGSDSQGISNGAVAGIVVALILGIIFIGGLAGFFWRKHKNRQYNKQHSWSKMDDDITPFPANSREPKPVPYRDDDGYGSNNVSPNNRVVAQARQNAFFEDGSARPDSGVPQQFGAARSYGPYPAAPTVAASYGNDGSQRFSPGREQTSDYPFIETGGYPSVFAQQQDQHNPFADSHASSQTSPTHGGGPRQLVGPGAAGVYGASTLTPVPLGRPQAPNSYDDIASAEMYADDRYADDHLPAPPAIGRSAAYDDFDPENYSPRTAASNEWAGGASPSIGADAVRTSEISNNQLPESAALPTLRPMSSLMGAAAVNDEKPKTIPAKAFAQAPAQAPATQASPETYSDEKSRQLFSEVARYAGVATPVTPAFPQVTDSNSPLSSPLEQPQIMHASRLPAPPYQHGQPLSPLTEVSTPKSVNVPLVPTTETVAPTTQSEPPAQVAQAQPETAATSVSPPSHRRLPTPPRIVAPAAASNDDDVYGGI